MRILHYWKVALFREVHILGGNVARFVGFTATLNGLMTDSALADTTITLVILLLGLVALLVSGLGPYTVGEGIEAR